MNENKEIENILAFDTSTEHLGFGVKTSEGFWQISVDAGLKPSEHLFKYLETLLDMASLEPAAVDLLICASGPGSFTGLRIGFAAARGFSVVKNIPICAVSLIDVLGHHERSWPGPCVCLIDGKKQRYFGRIFNQGQAISDTFDLSAQDLKAYLKEQGFENSAPLLFCAPRGHKVGELRQYFEGSWKFEAKELGSTWMESFVDLGNAAYREGKILSKEAGPEYIRYSNEDLGIHLKA